MVTRALNFVDDQTLVLPAAPRPPLSDTEFRTFLDSVGQIVQPNRLRHVIYAGGIEPSLRRVVWKHILNVYPDGMTGRERMDYMKRKSAEYLRLRDTWRQAVHRTAAATASAAIAPRGSTANNELAFVTSMVRKDVLRTDRLHPFYAGTDDNQNIAALFNILTTYALNHPTVSYCQGMSDIASPLLVTMCDEAQAYICFCAVMRRLSANFMLDGVAMTLKFQHLGEALQYYDPEMAEYLRLQQADDLLFCYRWLLLEMKREFPFDDSLRMLEVLWSALPAQPPGEELRLAEREFVPASPTQQERAGETLLGAVAAAAAAAASVVQRQEPVAVAAEETAIVAAAVSGCSAKTVASDVPLLMPMPKQTQPETAYTKFCALHRQRSAQSLHLLAAAPAGGKTGAGTLDGSVAVSSRYGLDGTKHLNLSLDENATARRRNRIAAGLANGAHQRRIVQSLDEILDDHRAAMEEESATTASSRKAGGGHFKGLKERIVAGSRKTLNAQSSPTTPTTTTDDAPPTRVVRNFNEFLNLSRPTTMPTTGAEVVAVASETPETSDLNDAVSLMHQSHTVPLPPAAPSQDGSSPDDSRDEYFPMTTSMTRELRLELENLDRHVFSAPTATSHRGGGALKQTNPFLMDADEDEEEVGSNCTDVNAEIGYTKLCPAPSLSLDIESEVAALPRINDDGLDGIVEITRCPSYEKEPSGSDAVADSVVVLRRPHRAGNAAAAAGPDGAAHHRNSINRCSTSSANTDVFVWENPLHCFSPPSSSSAQRSPDEQQELDLDAESTGAEGFIETMCEGKKSITPIRLIQQPQPQQHRYTNGTNRRPGGAQRRSATTAAHRKGPCPINGDDSTDTDAAADASSSDDESDDHWRPSDTVQRQQLEQSVVHNAGNTVFIDEAAPAFLTVHTNGHNGMIDSAELSSSVEEASEAAAVVVPLLLHSPAKVELSPQQPQPQQHAPSATLTPTASASPTNQASATVRLASGGLPPPHEFGGGNPFLIILCVTMLMQNRHYVMRGNMDYNEMAIHFDKMLRKHNVTRVLTQARRMYGDYMRQQSAIKAAAAAAAALSSAGVSPNAASTSSSAMDTETKMLNAGLQSATVMATTPTERVTVT